MNGKLDILEKLTGDKVIIGYDLGEHFSQISYCGYSQEVPQTISQVAGSENFNIPTALCKRRGVKQWFFGKKAYKCAEDGEGTLVDGLLSLAAAGERVRIEEEEYDPVALLTLFVKRSLGLLTVVTPLERIGAMMLTCDGLNPRMVEILGRVTAGLDLKTKNILLQSHVESFYHYTIHQPAELWNHQVAVFDCAGGRLKSLRMECNRRTEPAVAFIEEESYPFVEVTQKGEADSRAGREADERFRLIAEKVCENRLITSVYLLGDGFREEWLQESLRYLCRNHRVFQGNNLYSKGACYGMKERLCPSDIGRKHVFLGSEKLKSNVGMRVIRRGMDSYFALLDAGTNWYEAVKDCDFLLESGNSFTILITPLTGRDGKNVEFVMEGLPARTDATVKLHMHMEMTDGNTVKLTVKDMGFGEIFISSGQEWTERFEV